MAPPVRHKQSDRLTLELLLATHFPNSALTEEMVAPAAAHCAKHCNWQVAAEVVTYRIVERSIILLSHTKYRNGLHIPGPAARGMEDYCLLPD